MLSAIRIQFMGRDSTYFLNNLKGVIHIGANLGTERDSYDKCGINVLWYEAIPEVFTNLQKLLSKYPKQKAICDLLTEKDGQEITFHVANNDGCSSSIFELADHKKIWPDVALTQTLKLTSSTLPTSLKRNHIDTKDYQAMVLDTQGSELLILKGAESILPQMKYIKTEAADFNSYKGGCTLNEIDEYLLTQGFDRIRSWRFAGKENVGSYFDVLYRNRNFPS